MQLYFQAFSTVIPKSGERPILTPDPWPGFSIGLSNCRPTSRGSVTIRSSDPRVAPKIVAERLFDQSRRRRDARRGEVPAPHRGAAVDGRDDRRRDAAGTGLPERRRADRRFPQAQRHGLSSGRDLPHGAGPGAVGGRSAPAGARHRRPARHRRVGLSGQHQRQHQCRRDRHRRQGRRHGAGGSASEQDTTIDRRRA